MAGTFTVYAQYQPQFDDGIMKAYYFFLVPVKDDSVATVRDPSLGCIRMNERFMKCLRSAVEEDAKYFLLKGVDERSVVINHEFLSTFMRSRRDQPAEGVLAAITDSFELSSASVEKYVALAQYPLVVLRQSKIKVIEPKSSLDVFNHAFLHLYQFLRVKRLSEELKKIDEYTRLSDCKYNAGILPCARFATCCVNNLLVECGSGKISLLKHTCHRMECTQKRFDNNLYQAVNQMIQ
ncbi:MAG: hypothetical protein ABW185_18930 [Sedimenticola sp.]